MTRILDGKSTAAAVRSAVSRATERLVATGARAPGLAVVLVGDDPASRIYVGSKNRTAGEAGFVHGGVEMPASSTEEEVLAQLERLNADDRVDGIIVQLPLPGGLDSRVVLDAIAPEKDVDGLHPLNAGNLWLDRSGLFPATPSGILELLDRAAIELQGMEAVIVGRSHLVGKPLAALLLQRHCTVTLCHSRTRDLAAVCRRADLLVAAVGQLALIGPDHVREGAVVIDVGIHRVEDRTTVDRLFPDNEKRHSAFEKRGSIVTGDVDYNQVAPRCSAITPVPGGVGPMTVAMLLANTLKASARRQGIDAGTLGLPDRWS
jgi:methylenetetrahydrofolate dehydrogenase (NADP+)/methenyltetrahydrofolate cyclohydrolase